MTEFNMKSVAEPAAEHSAPQQTPLPTLPIMEIFGPTVQGEGMVIGQKTMFVRTAGCDYRCRWCDSAFTWDGSAKDRIVSMTAHEVWQELTSLAGNRFSHVTISGGNPALLKNMGELVRLLHQYDITVAIETQGSRWQSWLLEIDQVTLSPKPPSSGMTTDWEKLEMIVQRLADRPTPYEVSLKIVIFNDKDLEYAKEIHRKFPDVTLYLQVGNEDVKRMDYPAHTMDLLRSYEQLIEAVMASSELNDVRVLPQLHALVWGNKQGV